MTRRLMLLVAGLLLALPMGATVAMADPADDTGAKDTGNACPEASPDADGDGDPSCGEEGNGKGKADRADDDKGQGNQGQGNQGQGNQGQGNQDGGDTGNACPPASPNAGGSPACGHADDEGNGNNGNGNNGNGNGNENNGNVCPPTSPNAGAQPPCGGDGGDNDNGDGDNGDGDETDPPVTTMNVCTAEAGDPGILTEDTLGQTIWDSGGDALSPLLEDPQANGIISEPVHQGGEGTPLEPVTDEVACTVDLLLDEETFPIDL